MEKAGFGVNLESGEVKTQVFKADNKVKSKNSIGLVPMDASGMMLGPTARLSPRQVTVLRENVGKSLTPNFLKLEPGTTRSSPRLVSVSATREIGAHTSAKVSSFLPVRPVRALLAIPHHKP